MAGGRWIFGELGEMGIEHLWRAKAFRRDFQSPQAFNIGHIAGVFCDQLGFQE